MQKDWYLYSTERYIDSEKFKEHRYETSKVTCSVRKKQTNLNKNI